MTELTRSSIKKLVAPMRVKPGKTVTLPDDFDPGQTARYITPDDAEKDLKSGITQLAEYQARLAAQDRHAVLVVLQALDAAGKDGTIRHVMSGVNPAGVTVRGFKIPSAEELNHDYLWRFASKLPERGMIGIFNRSYYEEVLVVRVHPENLERQHLPGERAEKGVWKRRYRDINAWERYLTENGVHIVKLFLNVSKDEQRRRFLDRIDHPDKNWKFSANDVHERASWDAYQKAYSEMLSSTSTEWAPWHVIPADNKWFARLAAAAIIVGALMDIDPQYPKLSAAQRAALKAERAALSAES